MWSAAVFAALDGRALSIAKRPAIQSGAEPRTPKGLQIESRATITLLWRKRRIAIGLMRQRTA